MVTQEDYTEFKASCIKSEDLQSKLDEMTSQINSEIAG
jgi:hypothetical protein